MWDKKQSCFKVKTVSMCIHVQERSVFFFTFQLNSLLIIYDAQEKTLEIAYTKLLINGRYQISPYLFFVLGKIIIYNMSSTIVIGKRILIVVDKF